jgi:hypothetical protein
MPGLHKLFDQRTANQAAATCNNGTHMLILLKGVLGSQHLTTPIQPIYHQLA